MQPRRAFPLTTLGLTSALLACGDPAAPPSLPAPVSAISWDSGGANRATSMGITNWCVDAFHGVLVYFGAIDPMFVTFSGGVYMPFGAPGGAVIVPRQWAITSTGADSATAVIAVRAAVPSNPTAIVVYPGPAGTVHVDSLRSDSVLFVRATYDVATAAVGGTPVGVVTATFQARPNPTCR
jgi:hypothetical protein